MVKALFKKITFIVIILTQWAYTAFFARQAIVMMWHSQIMTVFIRGMIQEPIYSIHNNKKFSYTLAILGGGYLIGILRYVASCMYAPVVLNYVHLKLSALIL